MVSEPQSEGKENQQEETAATAATATICISASPATARSSEKCRRAPESGIFPARLRAWLCSWGPGAHRGGVEPHCHPMTYNALQQQSNSRLSHEVHGLHSNPQERPLSSHPQMYTDFSSSRRRNGGQEQRRVGLEVSRKTLSQIVTFCSLTLSATEEMTTRASSNTGRSNAWTGYTDQAFGRFLPSSLHSKSAGCIPSWS